MWTWIKYLVQTTLDLNDSLLLLLNTCCRFSNSLSVVKSLVANWCFIQFPGFFPKVVLKVSHLSKVRIFWEGHKNLKKLPLKIWRCWVASNFKWKIFSKFVAFSEYLNFNCTIIINSLDGRTLSPVRNLLRTQF